MWEIYQRLNEEKQELIDHINNLEQENQKFLELILKFSKGDKKILSSYDLKFIFSFKKNTIIFSLANTKK